MSSTIFGLSWPKYAFSETALVLNGSNATVFENSYKKFTLNPNQSVPDSLESQDVDLKLLFANVFLKPTENMLYYFISKRFKCRK